MILTRAYPYERRGTCRASFFDRRGPDDHRNRHRAADLFQFLGIKIVEIKPERVTAELTVREDFRNRGGVMHGGALMAFADSLGGTAANANLRRVSAPRRSRARPTFSPASRSAMWRMPSAFRCIVGRSTIVLQTRITRNDGKLAAVVTQTQMVLEAQAG